MNYWEIAGKFFTFCFLGWLLFILIIMIIACVQDYLREKAREYVREKLYKAATFDDLDKLRHEVTRSIYASKGYIYNPEEHPLFI